MLKHYIIVFLVSMVPLIELRGAAVYAGGFGLPVFQSFLVCMIGNMIPVPIIYFFARKVLEWGADKPYIGKFFTFCLEKGKKGGGHRCVDRNTCSKHSGYGGKKDIFGGIFRINTCMRNNDDT